MSFVWELDELWFNALLLQGRDERLCILQGGIVSTGANEDQLGAPQTSNACNYLLHSFRAAGAPR